MDGTSRGSLLQGYVTVMTTPSRTQPAAGAWCYENDNLLHLECGGTRIAICRIAESVEY
jgi:hypothetical protein